MAPAGNPAMRTRLRRRCPSISGLQPWAQLPDSVLYSISRRLTTFVDFAALAGTCRAWRSFAAGARGEFMASQAPLLCGVDGSCLYDPVNGRSFRHHRLRSLMGRRNATIVSVCHGFLAVKAGVGKLPQKRLRFLNLFTGEEFADVPLLPKGCLVWVVLTAPPTSPNCLVIACFKYRQIWRHGAVLCCRRGDGHWSFRDWYGPEKPVVVGRGLCALDWRSSGKLMLTYGPYRHPTLTSRLVQGRATPPLYCVHLVDVGGELLFIEHWRKQAVAYRVGPPQQGLVRVKGLGGRAVLVSRDGSAVSERPGEWGGQPDCIYFICGCGPALNALRVADGGVVESPFGLVGSSSTPDPLKQPGSARDRAFWVLPSLCP